MKNQGLPRLTAETNLNDITEIHAIACCQLLRKNSLMQMLTEKKTKHITILNLWPPSSLSLSSFKIHPLFCVCSFLVSLHHLCSKLLNYSIHYILLFINYYSLFCTLSQFLTRSFWSKSPIHWTGARFLG